MILPLNPPLNCEVGPLNPPLNWVATPVSTPISTPLNPRLNHLSHNPPYPLKRSAPLLGRARALLPGVQDCPAALKNNHRNQTSRPRSEDREMNGNEWFCRKISESSRPSRTAP